MNTHLKFCRVCGVAHNVSDDSYFSVQGSISIGEDSRNIINHLNEARIYCPNCLLKTVSKGKESVESGISSKISRLKKLLDFVKRGSRE
jgi:hypothetical protein